MYDGNQVIRFENKYKASDLTGLSIELTKRKGTGNYDLNRTKFNQSFIATNKNLKAQVYSMLKENSIHYNNGKNTNLLNGAIVSSGKEFFQSLGMNFKESNRIHQKGKYKGEPILVPDINSDKDIPVRVKEFFDYSYQFLEGLVGRENVVCAEIHYDEDTPHMHFYFMPVVDEVKRKVFEKDDNGNLIKHEVIGKDGNVKLMPIQKKDENGKGLFEIEKGKFLNCDPKIQDKYNEFITSKGFNLYRGNIGANKEHITKAKHTLNELESQINDISLELNKNKQLNEIELELLKDIQKINNDEILNPIKRKVIGYKDEDINNLIDYSKNLKKDNLNSIKDIKEKDIIIDDLKSRIDKLSLENDKYKDTRAIKERDIIISNQKKLIDDKNRLIYSLERQIDSLKERISYFINLCINVCKALGHKIGINYERNDDVDLDLINDKADDINFKYEYRNNYKSNDKFER